MSIQANFPALKPTLLLDFANVKALDPRITFTRASEGRYYDGRTFAKAEENLLIWSQAFDDASWIKTRASVTANSTTAPDGTTTADTLTGDGTSLYHSVSRDSVVSGAATRVFSVFAKAGTNNFIQLNALSTSQTFANFDLSSGTVGSAGTDTTASIVDAGNGWYRCIIASAASLTGVELCLVTSGTAVRRETNTLSTTVFLWGAQLEQRSAVTAYTATTTQPITNYIPVLMTAAAGVARFDHNPVTEESLGLLIEELRSNLVLRSEEFNDANWTKTRSSINANSYVSPGGALTADALIDTTDNDTHFVSQNVTTTAVAITFSVYAKAAGRNFVYLSINDSGNVARTTFYNLSTGAVGTTGTGITASIVPVGNGWYRCIATVATAYAGANPCTIGVASADNTATYAGNGFSGVAIWGAQLEAGAGPATSYIPTVAAQVTRSADAASMTGTNFSSWYRPDEGTLYGESSSSRDANRWPFGVDDGSASNVIGVRFTSTQVQNRIFVSAVSQADIGVAHTTGYAKTALGYKFNDVAASVNGGAAGTDTSANIPVVSQFTIGRISGGAAICGHISKIAFYPARVTNAQLQALTS